MDDDQLSVTETAVGRESRRRKRWSDFCPQQRTAIVLGALVELVMTTVALRDLVRRPAKQVRGGKLLWVLTFFVQPIGPILYFLVGRRAPR
jgi:Phospholipase_D-nuclease N-terminal